MLEYIRKVSHNDKFTKYTLNIRLRRIHRGSATLKTKPLQPSSSQRERREKEEGEGSQEEMEMEDIVDDTEDYYFEDPSNIG